MAEQQEQPHPGLAGCYRHPERATGVRCTRCDRPVCPACMISAAVGYQCPACVQGAAATARRTRPRTIAGASSAGDARLVTKALVGLNLAVYAAVLLAGHQLVDDLGMLGYATDRHSNALVGVAAGDWYRLLTAAFLHAELWHLGFNMLALWFLGPPLEAALGRARFLALYLLAALAGSALSYLLALPHQLSLGASGAIFGLFGGTAVLLRRMRSDMRPIGVLLAINLVVTFLWPDIAWQAHIGGLVAGAAIAAGMVHAPREHRTAVQVGTCAVVLLAVAASCAVRTAQLL